MSELIPPDPTPHPDDLLKPGEAAKMFRVNPKTLRDWATADEQRNRKQAEGGPRPSRLYDAIVWTHGGHRRYKRAILEEIVRKGFRGRQPR